MAAPGLIISAPKGIKGVYLTGDRYRVRFMDGTTTAQARLVAAVKLGRPLTAEEVVHHKNGDSTDDRMSNLHVFPSHAEHMRKHGLARGGRPLPKRPQLLLRPPPELKVMLAARAKRQGRSINAECIIILQRAIYGDGLKLTLPD